MSPQTKTEPAFVIVVGVDFESDGELALDTALRYGSRLDKVEIHVVHAARGLGRRSSPPPDADAAPASQGDTILDELEERCLGRIEQLADAADSDGDRRIVCHVRLGRPASQIIQLAQVLDADLVVVGTHNRRGIKRVVLGSVAARVTQLAPCPVWVVRPKAWDAIDAPEVEPPCPDCVSVREQSGGETVWCARHELARYRPRAHRYGFGAGPSSGGPESSCSWGPRSG